MLDFRWVPIWRDITFRALENQERLVAICKLLPMRVGEMTFDGAVDGLKLARFVRSRWPPIKIVATSGLVPVEDDDLPAGSVFLPKPYRSAPTSSQRCER